MDRCRNLPEQVLFDILIYLPVICLLRFKAVCKDWFSLIESTDFISEHLSHSRDSKEDDLIILVGSFNNEPTFALLRGNKEIDYDIGIGQFWHSAKASGNRYEEIDYDIGIGQFWHSAKASDILLSCYCDGIVCLDCRNEIALWNPALKQLRPIPPPLLSDRVCGPKQLRPIPPPLLSDRVCDATSALMEEKKWTTFNVSFGFDVKSNDYKLVGILLEYSNDDDLIGNQVEVYNLRGDNSWRIIHKNDDLPFYEILTFDAISSGRSGKCFWIGRTYDYTAILLSFGFSDDAFRTMPLPGKLANCRYNRHYDLDFLDDKVVYIVEGIINTLGDKAIDIWMLNEFGVVESWNLIYKLGPFYFDDVCGEVIRSLRISKSGEFFICSKSDGLLPLLYLYNLHTQQEKHISEFNFDWFYTVPPTIHYKASLLSLKSANIVWQTD